MSKFAVRTTLLCLAAIAFPGTPGFGQREPDPPRAVGPTGEEQYLARRVEVLRERLELTEQLGQLEVELLELQVQGHDRRTRHLTARQELHEQAVEFAERNVARREQLRVQGVLSPGDFEEAKAAVGTARAALLELAVERDELETELATAKIAVKRRGIEARLELSAIRLELLEAEHQLESRRRIRETRERYSEGRTRDREATDEAEADAVEENDAVSPE